jgi:hypothetical protein
MKECAMDELDLVLFQYITRGNLKSNEHLKRYLKRYPGYREEIIEFTANWRAFAILDRVLPPPPALDPETDRQLLQCARSQMRGLLRRRSRMRVA